MRNQIFASVWSKIGLLAIVQQFFILIREVIMRSNRVYVVKYEEK